MEIKKYPEEPFSDLFLEMNITSSHDKDEFFTAISFFTNECEKIAKDQILEEGNEISAYFNWRAIESDRYFKIFFTYYHSEELYVGIDNFEEISKEVYVDTYNEIPNEDCGCNGE